MKILVAVPVREDRIPTALHHCLVNEQFLAFQAGDEMEVRFLHECSHIAIGRNQLANSFLKGDYEKLFFLDSDVTFELGSIHKLCHLPVDLVGGGYRYKTQEEGYPMGWLPGPLQADENRLLEVMNLPGGFMCVSRRVFDEIKKATPERSYIYGGERIHAFFEMPFSADVSELIGEDAWICWSWRKCGGKVFLDPELTLTHWHNHVGHTGHIGNWLKARWQAEQKAKFPIVLPTGFVLAEKQVGAS